MNKNMNYEHKPELCTMVTQDVLLSMSGRMGLHSYMAQVGIESGHGVFLLLMVIYEFMHTLHGLLL